MWGLHGEWGTERHWETVVLAGGDRERRDRPLGIVGELALDRGELRREDPGVRGVRARHRFRRSLDSLPGRRDSRAIVFLSGHEPGPEREIDLRVERGD